MGWSITFVMIFFIAGTKAEICQTPSCIDLSNTLTSWMDTSVDPCEDFYQHVCKGYSKITVLPSFQASWSPNSEINANITATLVQDLTTKTLDGQPPVFQIAKDFYQSCLDTATIEKVGLGDMKKRLQSYGGWPLLEADWKESSFDWIATTKKLAEAGQISDFFLDPGIGPNDKNVKETLITLTQPGLGLDKTYLLNGVDDLVVKAYKEVILEIAEEFGADKATAEQDITDTLNLEMQIAKILVPAADLRDLASVLQILKISELQTTYSYIDWMTFFTSRYGEDAKITKDDLIQLYTPSYVKNLEPILTKAKKRVLANYMMQRVVFGSVRLLTQRLIDIHQKILNVRLGVTESEPRPKFCFGILKNQVTKIMAAQFVQNHFTPEEKEKATEIVKLTAEQLPKVIEKADWLDSATKAKALDKVKNTALFVGYPDELLDNTLLSDYYKKLSVSTSDFYGNIINARLFGRSIAISKLHKPFDPRDWKEQGLDDILESNAQNVLTANAIDVFAGKLQGMFFNLTRSPFVNVGTLSRTVGHELTHTVDDRGGEIDKNGDLAEWWNKDTKAVFKKKAQAIVDQYSTYVVKAVNMTLKPAAMIGEIIADQGGYKIALMAFEEAVSQQQAQDKAAGKTGDPGLIGFEKYSPSQLFWITSAAGWCNKITNAALKSVVEKDSTAHPPNEVRVNGPLRNSAEFAKAFNCAEGTFMNPKEKLNVW